MENKNLTFRFESEAPHFTPLESPPDFSGSEMANRTNHTSAALFFSRAELISWTSAFVVADVVIVLGNAFALYIFLMKKRMHRSKAHYFLINLAVTDELVGTISLPLYLHQLVSFIKTGWNPWSVSFYVFMSVDLLSGFASMLTVVIIALDRFYAICFPFRHRITAPSVYYYLISAIWLFSGVVVGLWLIWVKNSSGFFDYLMFASIFGFILTLSIAHVLILVKVKLHPVRNHNSRRSVEQERRLTRVLNIVTLAFLLTWLPFHFLNFTLFFCRGFRYYCMPNLNVVYFTKFLQYSGSFINPLVYYVNNKEFRKTLGEFLNRGNNSLSLMGLTAYTGKYSVSWKQTRARDAEQHANNVAIELT